jgi:hypothetical protein
LWAFLDLAQRASRGAVCCMGFGLLHTSRKAVSALWVSVSYAHHASQSAMWGLGSYVGFGLLRTSSEAVSAMLGLNSYTYHVRQSAVWCGFDLLRASREAACCVGFDPLHASRKAVGEGHEIRIAGRRVNKGRWQPSHEPRARPV